MTGAFRVVNAIYWLALTAWIAVIAAAGIAATAAFTTLPDLPVRIGDLPLGDAAAHGRYAAGHVMEPVFTFVDVIQVVVAPVALLALVLQLTVLGQRWCAKASLVRAACLVGAAVVLLYRVAVIAPPMNHDLHAYRRAAAEGDAQAAAVHRAAFDRRHPIASDLYGATGAMLILAVVASAVAAPPAPRAAARLEAPELLKRARR